MAAPGSGTAPFACPVEERMYGYASQPDALSSCRVDITLAYRETLEHCDHPGRGAGGTHPPPACSRALRRTVRLRAGLHRPGPVSTHSRTPGCCAAGTACLSRGYLG